MFIQRHLVRAWGSVEIGSKLHTGSLCLQCREWTFIDLKKAHKISQSLSSIAWSKPNFTLFYSCAPRADFVYLYLNYFYIAVWMPFLMLSSTFFFFFLFTFPEGCILSEAHMCLLNRYLLRIYYMPNIVRYWLKSFKLSVFLSAKFFIFIMCNIGKIKSTHF